MSSKIPVDLNDPEFYRNPYPAFKWLRENEPVCWFEPMGGWLISKASDITFCSKDARFSRNLHKIGVEHLPIDDRLKYEPFLRRFGMWEEFREGKELKRIRKLLGKGFTPNALQPLRPFIEAAIDRLLDGFVHRDSVDVVSEFAIPLPSQIITHILGVSAYDYCQLVAWGDDVNTLMLPLTPQTAQKAKDSYEKLEAVFLKEILQRRKNPIKDEVLTQLVFAEDEGDILTDEELCSQCILLLSAGNETNRILIVNGLIELDRHPDQFKRLKENPDLMPSAIEELLRYTTPGQIATRRVEEDLELRGQKLRAGDVTYSLLGSANRDPEYFSDPDCLDLTRTNNKHFAFGAMGQPHSCLAPQLARFQADITFRKLFERFPNLKIDQEELKRQEWNEHLIFRYPKRLPVILK